MRFNGDFSPSPNRPRCLSAEEMFSVREVLIARMLPIRVYSRL